MYKRKSISINQLYTKEGLDLKIFYFILKADEDSLDADREDDQDDDESSNQGDNAFAWPTNNSYDEQRLVFDLSFNTLCT